MSARVQAKEVKSARGNAPGSTHAKRWQDVEQPLEAGIDVYTTLNRYLADGTGG